MTIERLLSRPFLPFGQWSLAAEDVGKHCEILRLVQQSEIFRDFLRFQAV
jgi:hypothetical protein